MSEEQILSTRVASLNIQSGHKNANAEIRTPSSSLKGFAEEAGIGKAIFHNGSISVEAKVNEIIILSDDLSAWTREIEGVRFLCAA